MDKIFNNVRTKYLNKLLNTRKQRFSFIKLYLINEYHIEFNAKRLKQVLYDEVLPTEEYEEEMYNLYNIYTNLLNDCLSNTLFIEKNISIDYFNFDNVISSVLLLYDSNIEIIFLFMIMNYLLLKNNLPIINQYKKYNRFINSLQKHDEDELYSLIIESINNLNPFDIDYYKTTKETTKELIVSFVKDNESIIKNEGKIKRMFLFGSYASGLTRFDSDIDYYIKEWCAHNFAYHYPLVAMMYTHQTIKQTKESSMHVDLNTNDEHSLIYKKWWWVFWLN